MTDNIAKLDREQLLKLVGESRITVARTDQHVFTVYSESEPRFCYDANSIAEVQDLVVGTYRSFAKHFHDVEDFEIDFRIAGAEPEVPVERVLSKQSLEPVFDKAA